MVKGKIATATHMLAHLLRCGYPESVRTEPARLSCVVKPTSSNDEDYMGRAALLWFLGIPIPVLLLMWVLGWLH